MIVSHDRDFLDGLVDKVYEFRGGRVKEHLGGIADFLERLKIESLHELEKSIPDLPSAGPEKKNKPVAEQRRRQNADRNADKKLKNKIAALEKNIAKLEAEISGLEQRLSAPEEGDDIMGMTQKYLELKNELDRDMDLWASSAD